ncbi:MAG: phosphoribosylformylglycinamidine synthase [Bacteroidales bacterium]|nr:phosphoribosylformylglycinamidine synthase [Bacteroidales bacterium]
MSNKRLFVEKRERFNVEAESLLRELNENLSLRMKSLRLLNVYDLFGFSDELVEKCRYSVFGETVTDTVSDHIDLEGRKYLAVEYIPGQFDQRASSAVDCVHLAEPSADIRIRSSRLLIFDDDLSDADFDRIAHYYINPVECRRKDLSVLRENEQADVKPLEDLSGFTAMGEDALVPFCRSHGLAMNADDLREVVNYFKKEGRDPSETELRILDTYWSDHCRHTTFTSEIEEITVDDSFLRPELEASLQMLDGMRRDLGREHKPLCLMELATIGARWLKAKGKLEDLEQSEENNACSIFINASVDGKPEKWLLQFKNETHNHPTEIEPFGGAATCLGGAIRDPLSGRAYVYQAMRVTGAGNICASVADTIPGKLPQAMISRKAASGYSSYGNQIGLATTHVREIYSEGYTAKRMEIGAVVGAVKAENVRRESPAPGDVVLLLGGRTGRDGIGGATGSSKEHTEASLETCGSEVQKGNAPEERQLQRLFRRPEATRLIKKSNDFGAGGVSVAIGELADGLDIWLDRVPVKYSGLNATELAISESQERMAVVIEAADEERFRALCAADNIEVTHVAEVTATGRMRMYCGGKLVCDLARSFIDSAGAKHYAKAAVSAVEDKDPFLREHAGVSLEEKMLGVMSSPNVASQKGLVEMFDSTIGRSTVLMPYGGLRQTTETQVSVQKLPVDGYTDTASVMAFGYNPDLAMWSPYHSAAYAVVEACTKVACSGADWSGMRFSYQEYFERMTKDPHTWGKPLAALLGALKMQHDLGLPSIGGKDSMSGTFEHIHVPPTLVAFGITTVDAGTVISPEFKKAGNRIYLLKHTPLADYMPDTQALAANWNWLRPQIAAGKVVSAWSLSYGGVAEALVKMAMGNALGVDVRLPESGLFSLGYGSVVLEATDALDFAAAHLLGTVTEGGICINGCTLSLDKLESAYESRYFKVFPPRVEMPDQVGHDGGVGHDENVIAGLTGNLSDAAPFGSGITRPGEAMASDVPLVCLPVFPGTNCDYDTAKAFRNAGAEVRPFIFRNLRPEDVLASIDGLAAEIDGCQILAFCGGFSSGDEPDGSGKFIADVINNAKVGAAITALLKRGGLILGICNGFQALVKSGLLPYGRLGCVTPESPTLFRNDINRHISLIATTEVASVASPWLSSFKIGDRHSVAFSHGEGKFTVSEELARELFANGQVAFRYVDNPNGSSYNIEGILSPDGQILGKMGHSERWEPNLFKNIAGERRQSIFENAVNYFKHKNG